MGQRRELRFKTLKDARAELKRLEKGPVVTTGNWSYYQILDHLQINAAYSMTSFPSLKSWWLRRLAGPMILGVILKQESLPAGTGAFIPVNPNAKGNEKKALAQLRKTLTDLEKYEGPWAEHPIFGKMNKEKWFHLTSLHLANHLGWAKLKTDQP
ncbi:MAG TPA: DUF1569 domain-containing protein [bacterium]|nr:DUF1569 domain-containing protein [bacterium]